MYNLHTHIQKININIMNYTIKKENLARLRTNSELEGMPMNGASKFTEITEFERYLIQEGIKLIALDGAIPNKAMTKLLKDYDLIENNEKTIEKNSTLFKVNAENISDVVKAITNDAISNEFTIKNGTLYDGRLFYTYDNSLPVSIIEPNVKTRWIEFIQFSRIDSLPIFKQFIQESTGDFISANNTFPASNSMISCITNIAGINITPISIDLIAAFKIE